jgi:hypothetical protein
MQISFRSITWEREFHVSNDIFQRRERAFEAVYFAKLDAELIEELHRKRAESRDRKELAQATAINDEDLLDRIVALGVSPINIEALSLAPLICVAWANGSLDQKERTEALEAAMAQGMDKGTPSYELFESLLSHAPDLKLMNTWREYIASLLSRLDAPACEQIRNSLLDRAEMIARAAGGLLGLGSISKEEQKVLDQIESAMS